MRTLNTCNGRSMRPGLMMLVLSGIISFSVPTALPAQETRPAGDPKRPNVRRQVRAPARALRRIKALIESDRPTVALQAVTPLIARFPGDARVHILCGEAHYSLEHIALAVQHFEKALVVDPRQRGRVYHLGLAYQTLERLEDADKVFQAMLSEKAASVQARGQFGLGLNHALRGDSAAAEEHYNQSVRLNPRSYLARYRIGQLALERRDFKVAEAQLRRVLEESPLHHGAAYNLALLLARTERTDEAETMMVRSRRIQAGKERIALLKARLRKAPAEYPLIGELADVHAELGDWKRATLWYQNALRYGPRDAELALKLAAAHVRTQHLSEAERIYRDLLRRTPPIGGAVEPLCELLEKSGRTDEASAIRGAPTRGETKD